MQINLTSIDTDKVMAKKKFDDITLAEKHRCEGHNELVTHNETLTLDMDAEKMADLIEPFLRLKNSYSALSRESHRADRREKAVNISNSLIQNPTWMKIGVKK